MINAIIATPFFFFQGHRQRPVPNVSAVQEMVNTSINMVNAEAQLARIPEAWPDRRERQSGRKFPPRRSRAENLNQM
ncbi:MAG: hypothetical protein ACLT8E_00455 [Akkermansia sp.]